MRKSLPAFLLFLLIVVFPKHAFAGMAQEVLGVSTSSAPLPQISATTEGPGLILPDSPFFFLDRFKQNVRLTFAFSPEEKAKVRETIAGERLAELRFMLAKNNRQAASIALQGVSENLKQASAEVSKAQFQGKNVSKLAENINDSIKLKQKSLDELEQKSDGALKLEVQQVQESVFESKAEIDDALPQDKLENEIRSDLERKINRKIVNASSSATLLRKDLEILSVQASQSASKSLKRREEALREAIAKSDGELKKAQEKLLEDEKSKQLRVLEAQKRAGEDVKKAFDDSQAANLRFGTAQKTLIQLKSIPPAPTPSSSNSSSGSGSGSGSSGGSSSSAASSKPEDSGKSSGGSGKSGKD